MKDQSINSFVVDFLEFEFETSQNGFGGNLTVTSQNLLIVIDVAL